MLSNMDPDEYRNTNIRWLGYAKAIGAAISQVIPGMIEYALQSISTLYVGVDIAVSSRRIFEAQGEPEIAIIKGLDVLIFHLFATIIIPPLFAAQLSSIIDAIIPLPLVSSIGPLCMLTFLIEPLDKYVTIMQDKTSRKLMAMILKNYKNYDLDNIFTKPPQ